MTNCKIPERSPTARERVKPVNLDNLVEYHRPAWRWQEKHRKGTYGNVSGQSIWKLHAAKHFALEHRAVTGRMHFCTGFAVGLRLPQEACFRIPEDQRGAITQHHN